MLRTAENDIQRLWFPVHHWQLYKPWIDFLQMHTFLRVMHYVQLNASLANILKSSRDYSYQHDWVEDYHISKK